jgi:hypothetical protein
MPTANFSTAVLENCTPVLRVAELTGVTWSDLGSPRRAVESVRRFGAGSAWLERLGLNV